MKACVILKLVSGALQDLEPGLEKRWPWECAEPERISLLDFLNSAIRAICLQRPDAAAVTESIRLEPGARQAIPTRARHLASRDALTLIELVRNMGADGETPGLPIAPVAPDILTAWGRSGITGEIVENYAYDRTVNPSWLWVYPAVPACGDVWVEAVYSAKPIVVASPEQEIGISDQYAAAIEHHILASVLGGDNSSSNSQKAAYHVQLYSSLMGIKSAVDFSWPKAKSSAIPGGGQ